MNLISLFNSLSIPIDSNNQVFNAVPIPDYPDFRIAIDEFANPIILFMVLNEKPDISLSNFKLKNLKLQHNVYCKIIEPVWCC
jgi:hypothetical protein